MNSPAPRYLLHPRLLRHRPCCCPPRISLPRRLRLSSTMASSSYAPRYIDIGINLADPIFRGRYHGKQRHPDDLSAVISRAKEVGCQKLIVTGSDLTSSKHALELAKEYPGVVYTTAGIHPCSSSVFSSNHKQDADGAAGQEDQGEEPGHSTPCDPDPSKPVSEDHEACAERTAQVISSLRSLIAEARSSPDTSAALVAFGEFGLDYDRLHYCSRRVQLHSFAAQLDLVLEMKPQLPLFLHSRAAHADFVGLLKEKFGPRLEKLERGGVVHSFTGTAEEMRELMDLGLYIGTNGCSFKTAENCDVVKEIHLDRLMLETDGPWCEVRPSHEGWKYLVEKIKADNNKAKSKEQEEAAIAAEASEAAKETSIKSALSETPVLAAATAALEAASLSVPGLSGPKSSSSTTGSGATSTNATSTPRTPSTTAEAGPKPRRKQPPPVIKKQQQKEPEVPERWKSVKKEKWVEGAMVKSRNEPCMIERVGTIVAAVKGVSVEEVCEAAWENTNKVFKLE